MPSVSSEQHRAMEAAAHGSGKLGIPPKVAKDFVAADKGKKKFSAPKEMAKVKALRSKPEAGPLDRIPEES